MTAHLHGQFVPGCYRCELNKDEIPGPHECDALTVDWAPCELCGIRHTFCSVCGEVRDDCESEEKHNTPTSPLDLTG